MGFMAEKQKIEGKIAVVKRIVLIVIAVLLAGLCVFSFFCPGDTWKYYFKKPDVAKRNEGELRIHFIDVGQGDATLLEFPDGKNMLIDGGNGRTETATTILRYLNALKIDRLEYLLVTHADSDHCGGLDVILKYKEVAAAYLPCTKPMSNDEYAAFYSALLDEECQTEYSSRKIHIESSDPSYPYTLAFLYPYTSDVGEELETETATNDSSAVVWLDYFGTSALFSGDASEDVEEALLRDDRLGLFEGRGVQLDSTEIFKVAHHGSSSSNSVEFLKYLNVKTSVISCGKNNIYGHPTEKVRNALKEVHSEIYRTDESGNIVITISPNGSYVVDTIENK